MKKNSNLILEFYKSRELCDKLEDLYSVLRHKEKPNEVFSNFKSSIIKIVDNMNLDKTKFEKLFGIYINSEKKEDLDNLKNYVHTYYKIVEQDVIKIPNSMEKACEVLKALIKVEAYKDEYQVYDAIVLLQDEISKDEVENIFSYWKESEDNIWVSYDFMDDLDRVSHYRFKETFEFEGFDSVFKKEESELQFRFLEYLFSEDTKQLAFNLWLIDRIPEYIDYNLDLVGFILKFIVKQWNPKGFWDSNVVKTIHERVIEKKERYKPPEPIFGDKPNIIIGINDDSKLKESQIEWEPSTYITALCSLCLLKYPISDNMREIGNLGAKWLSENQNCDGSWSDIDYLQEVEYADGYRVKFLGETNYKPDLFVTLISIEAIFRSNITNKERYVMRGFEWIKNQQDKFGNWNYNHLFEYPTFPLTTVLVLELNKLISNVTNVPESEYILMSKDFLNSSIRFLSDENLNSRRLAIITAYHGIEFFLYSILTQDNISIFKKDGETIGMKNALNKFQEDYLKPKKIIKHNEIVYCKNSLMELKNLRDNIIHQAYSVDQSKCEDLVKKARTFISKYSIELWAIDILS